MDPYLAVRAGTLYVTVIVTMAIWVWRRPGSRAMAGAMLATFWNLTAVLALQMAAARAGWWHFEAEGGLLLGMPVEMYLSWAWLWGAAPALAFPAAPLVAVAGAALLFDLALMPLATPVLQLGPTWLAGELIGIVAGLVPAQLLARWTARDERLASRALLQVVTFSGLMLLVMPAVAVAGSGDGWRNPIARPMWQLSLIVQLLAVPGILGLTAVQEFVTRGGGTPVPFDPPRMLVTSGVYAYVRNPMQTSGVLLLLLLGAVLENVWLAAAGVMAHLYSLGLAGWDEDADLRRRFGDRWIAYRRQMRPWLPRWRPWVADDQPPARLFVAGSCGMCSEVGRWFAARDARGLAIVAAETHPRPLTRITYEPGDGSAASSGVAAIARALEHVHLGWAMLAFVLRLPLVLPLAQLLVDASGGEARAIARTPTP